MSQKTDLSKGFYGAGIAKAMNALSVIGWYFKDGDLKFSTNVKYKLPNRKLNCLEGAIIQLIKSYKNENTSHTNDKHIKEVC